MLAYKGNLSPLEQEVGKVLRETVDRINKIDKDIENYQNRGSLRLDYVPVGTIIQDSARREIDIRNLKSQKEQCIEGAIVLTDKIADRLPEDQKTVLRQNILEQLRPESFEKVKEENKSVRSKFIDKEPETNLEDLRKRASMKFERSYDFSKFLGSEKIATERGSNFPDK